jgi:hypothetical protein
MKRLPGELRLSVHDDGAGLPADFKGAAELTAALKDVQVRWPPSSDLAPVLQSNGLPSGFGTLARLNEQLHDLQKRRP